MVFATILLCHVLAAIGVGPIFTLPFLANTHTAPHAVLVLLRFGAGATLLIRDTALDRAQAGSSPLALPIFGVVFSRGRIDRVCALTGR